MPRITPQAHRLALRSGITLHDLTVEPCKGYRNCCGCPTCANISDTIRAHRDAGRAPFTPDGKLRAMPRKKQPWDAAA